MEIRWVDGFVINVDYQDGAVIISANREGLQSLANILTDMANEKTSCHIHLDEYNSLEDNSAELIIERID